jgi:hypothetical protein
MKRIVGLFPSDGTKTTAKFVVDKATMRGMARIIMENYVHVPAGAMD